jgi:hypothetical protein
LYIRFNILNKMSDQTYCKKSTKHQKFKIERE